MKNKYFYTGAAFLAAFLIWTAAVSFIDVQPVGPLESVVGFAGVNSAFHRLTGVNMWIYDITDILSVIPLAIAAGFGLLGLVQLIKRKSLFKVDMDIIILGVFYAVVIGFFLFFQIFVINYRPVLIEGVLEASYPSSTTLLVLTILPTSMLQAKNRIKDSSKAKVVNILLGAFTFLMAFGRLVSGVHWLTDIIGGLLLAAGLVCIYAGCTYREQGTGTGEQ